MNTCAPVQTKDTHSVYWLFLFLSLLVVLVFIIGPLSVAAQSIDWTVPKPRIESQVAEPVVPVRAPVPPGGGTNLSSAGTPAPLPLSTLPAAVPLPVPTPPPSK